METLYKIWRVQKDSWWAADGRGLVTNIKEAGLYTKKEAEEAVYNNNDPESNIPTLTLVPIEQKTEEEKVQDTIKKIKKILKNEGIDCISIHVNDSLLNDEKN